MWVQFRGYKNNNEMWSFINGDRTICQIAKVDRGSYCFGDRSIIYRGTVWNKGYNGSEIIFDHDLDCLKLKCLIMCHAKGYKIESLVAHEEIRYNLD